MGLQLRRGRDGKLRPWWYAEYTRKDGSRAVVNLAIPIEGKPPESGFVKDLGNPAFQRSKAKAEAALAVIEEKERLGRMTKAAALRQY